MANDVREVSVALQNAQARLDQLRLFASEQRPFPKRTAADLTKKLPEHLSWGTPQVTAVLRQATQSSANPPLNHNWIDSLQLTETLQETAVSQPLSSNNKNRIVKLYPSIALGMLQKEVTAAGRIWLLLKYLDENGRGWLNKRESNFRLTDKTSNLRVCGKRQFRNLLQRGEGVFWVQDRQRIWIKSVAKVAKQLEVDRLKHQPVGMPVSVLTKKIGVVRAHLYASFHSGRSDAPISREKLAELSNVNPRIQRRYEKIAKVKKQTNYAVGQQTNAEALQEKAWQQGHATFTLTDFAGKQGQAGKSYLAWQLPNSYAGPHARLAKGRQKRINQELTDLFMKGMTGNGRDSGLNRRFFDNGRIAAKAFSKAQEDIYWKGNDSRGCHFWHVLENSTRSGQFLTEPESCTVRRPATAKESREGEARLRQAKPSLER